jgi:hypothetical protein
LESFLLSLEKGLHNISTIEFDEFGPILLIVTNGVSFPFHWGLEEEMKSQIIENSRSDVPIQEFQGQYYGPTYARMSDEPINPINHEEIINDDKSMLNLEYFDGSKDNLETDYKNRPQFRLEFDKV